MSIVEIKSEIIDTLSVCASKEIHAVITPGDCNVLLAFVDDAAHNFAALDRPQPLAKE